MTRDHAPGGKDLGGPSTDGFPETSLDFARGLEVALTLDQLAPSSPYPSRTQPRQHVYPAQH